MTILLLCVALWSRPALVPVTEQDLDRADRIQTDLALTDDAPRLAASGQVPGRFVVGFERKEVIADIVGLIRRIDEAGRFAVVDIGDDPKAEAALLSLKNRPGIRYVEPDYEVRAAGLPNDPLFLGYQWDKWVMYADQAWDITTGQATVKVAIVDNGSDYQHVDLQPNFRAGQYGRDFIDGDDDPRPVNTSQPASFHGTHVAGIVGAAINNNTGIAGWAQCQLVAVRVLNDSGSGLTSDLASGIRWAADNGCRIINMSLTAASAPTDVVEACQYAASRGCLLVAASGNDGAANIGYPAGLATVIAVGAIDQNSGRASYSNYGPGQELVACGTYIHSTVPGNLYMELSGTSMATPQVSGIAALMMSVDQNLSAGRVRALLAAAAIDMGTEGRDQFYGYGLVNARRAVELAAMDRQRGFGRLFPRVTGTTIISREFRLPPWVEQVTAFDPSGRGRRLVVQSGTVSLWPGVWFARLEGKGRVETKRLVVR